MHRLLLAAIVFVLAASSGPAAADSLALDEAQFAARFEAFDPRFARLDADVAGAEAEVTAAGARPDPSIAFDREEIFSDDGALPTSYLRIVLPFDVSGRRGLRIDAARSYAGAARSERALARLVLVVDGMRAYYQAAYARLKVDRLRGDRETLVRVVEIVRKRTGAGDASGYDLQRFELELAAYDDLLVSADLELGAARRRLASLVGAGEELVDASAELEVADAPPAIATLAGSALNGRGDYQAASQRLASARALGKAGARGWVPSFGLTAGVMSADLGDETAYGYVAGLSLSLPIFDRGQGERARAQAAQRAAEADKRWLESQVPAAVRQAHEGLALRLEQVRRFAETHLARLDGLLKSAETAYREGDASVVELLDAYRTARDARLRHLELRRDAKLAELDLWLALGRRL